MRKKMKITIAATNAPTSGRASSRFERLSVTRLDASEGAPARSVLRGVLMSTPVLSGGCRAPSKPGPAGESAGVRLHERQNLRDVGFVDERRTGQYGVAAAHD